MNLRFAIVLVASAALALGCTSEDESSEDSSADTTPASTSTEPAVDPTLEPADPSGFVDCPQGEYSICLNPWEVPPAEGPVEIEILGSGWPASTDYDESTSTLIYQCTGDISQPPVSREDRCSDPWGDGPGGPVEINDGSFSAKMTVEIDQADIEAGVISITNGDMFNFADGVALLRIEDPNTQ